MLLQKYVGESRRMVLQQILSQPRVGRKPILQVIIDLTTLEKRGKFKALDGLVRVYHGKRGLHLVVVYLVVGQWRVRAEFSDLSRQKYALTCSTGIKTGG